MSEASRANGRRLAGEIHDTLAQGLAMIVMQLADADSIGPGGLARLLRETAENLGRHFGGTIELAVSEESSPSEPAVESALAGIAREAITNAVKHSHATRVAVEVDFAKAGAVRVAVSDDGIGFDPNAGRADSYGLVSMQDRATRTGIALTFVTEPGAGTTVVASWSPNDKG